MPTDWHDINEPGYFLGPRPEGDDEAVGNLARTIKAVRLRRGLGRAAHDSVRFARQHNSGHCRLPASCIAPRK